MKKKHKRTKKQASLKSRKIRSLDFIQAFFIKGNSSSIQSPQSSVK